MTAAFQLTPQSLRLTVVLPANPIRASPDWSTAAPVCTQSTDTGLVTPVIVSSPMTRYSSAFVCSPAVEAKVRSRYFWHRGGTDAEWRLPVG